MAAMYEDPHRLRDDLCHYLAGSARTFRDILDDERHALPPALRGEIELLENFCRFAVAEFDRVIGRRLVQRACRDYKRSGDPIHAWGAFRMCRAWDLDVPEIVLDYLEIAAARLLATEADGGNPVAGAGAALGLFPARPGAGGNGAGKNGSAGLDGLRPLGRIAREKLQELVAAPDASGGDPYLGLRRIIYFNVAVALAMLPEDEDDTGDDATRKERAVIRYIRDRYAAVRNGG